MVSRSAPARIRRRRVETVRYVDCLHETFVDGRHVCCDQYCGASRVGYLAGERLCACFGTVDRYRRVLGRYGRVEKATASVQARACCGKVRGTEYVFDDMEMASDLEHDSYILA